MMRFLSELDRSPFLLYDGPMETRIEYGTSIKLDQSAAIFNLIYHEESKKVLQQLYQTDIEVVQPYHLPIILNAPTWRASRAHIERAGYRGLKSIEKVNQDCIKFVKGIRNHYSQHTIFITAPIGPECVDYSINFRNTIDRAADYHRLQIKAIAQEGVDVISIASMTNRIETIGCAHAASQAGLPYSVGVVLHPDGTLLDGCFFKNLIKEIDETVSPPPNFYVISCTHPDHAQSALQDHDPIYRRILGIKANGSNQPPQKLLHIGRPLADEPDVFADKLLALGKEYHFKIYGGCCGTDHKHLMALAKRMVA